MSISQANMSECLTQSEVLHEKNSAVSSILNSPTTDATHGTTLPKLVKALLISMITLAVILAGFLTGFSYSSVNGRFLEFALMKFDEPTISEISLFKEANRVDSTLHLVSVGVESDSESKSFRGTKQPENDSIESYITQPMLSRPETYDGTVPAQNALEMYIAATNGDAVSIKEDSGATLMASAEGSNALSDMNLEFFNAVTQFVVNSGLFENVSLLVYPQVQFPIANQASGSSIVGGNIQQSYSFKWQWHQQGQIIGLQMTFALEQRRLDGQRTLGFTGTALLIKPHINAPVHSSQGSTWRRTGSLTRAEHMELLTDTFDAASAEHKELTDTSDATSAEYYKQLTESVTDMKGANATSSADMNREFFQAMGSFVSDYAKFEDVKSLNYPTIVYPTPGTARGHMFEGNNILQEYDLAWTWHQVGSSIGLQMTMNRFKQTSHDSRRAFDLRGNLYLMKPSLYAGVHRKSATWTNEYVGKSSAMRGGISGFMQGSIAGLLLWFGMLKEMVW